MYSKEYFPRGRWFETVKSQGWEWVISDFWGRILLNKNRGIKWPVSPVTRIGGGNIIFDVDDLDNFNSPNCYFQSYDAQIQIGKGTYIAQGVGIITSNHDVYDLDKYSVAADVIIGKNCWLGMNAIVLPGVVLGDNTVVGAGSVVTHSFPGGRCVIAGNPAKVIKLLDSSKIKESVNIK